MSESLVPIWIPSAAGNNGANGMGIFKLLGGHIGKKDGKVLYMDREGVFGNGNAALFDSLFYKK